MFIVLLVIFYSLMSIDGTRDIYYLRFTTPKQTSLILGNSRTARGLVPSLMNEKLNQNVYNYSFNYGISPYGSSYLNSIKNKLDTTSRNGIFILSINPGNLAFEYPEIWDSTRVRERNGILNNLKSVSSNPNFDYLLQYARPLGYLFDSEYLLHEDGWLEMQPSVGKVDIKSIEQQASKELTSRNLHFSKYRMNYLEKTIKYLQKHGKVYLVRMPVSNTMKQIENDYYPWVDQKTDSLAKALNIEYFNFFKLERAYEYNDGSHLSPESAKEVTYILTDSILSKLENPVLDSNNLK